MKLSKIDIKRIERTLRWAARVKIISGTKEGLKIWRDTKNAIKKKLEV